MTFIQIIEIEGEGPGPFLAESDKWYAATESTRTLRREIIARDRSAPDRFVVVTFFDSYESAMENSNLPETKESAARIAEMAASVSFRDLDVIEERS